MGEFGPEDWELEASDDAKRPAIQWVAWLVSQTFAKGRAAVNVRPSRVAENRRLFFSLRGFLRSRRLATKPEPRDPSNHLVGLVMSEVRSRDGTSSVLLKAATS